MKRTSKTCSELFRFISYTILNNYYNWLFITYYYPPIGYKIGDGITYLLNTIYQFAGPVAGLIFGGLYSTIVLTGLHHSFHAIEAGLLANKDIGVNFLLPIWSMANVAQGGATLAVYFKTKTKNERNCNSSADFSIFRNYRTSYFWCQFKTW